MDRQEEAHRSGARRNATVSPRSMRTPTCRSTEHFEPAQPCGRYALAVALLLGYLLLPLVGATHAEEQDHPTEHQPVRRAPIQTIRSDRIELYTDASRDAARPVIRRLERMLDLLMHFWHRPVHRHIQVYLVDDLQNWTPEMLPNRHAYDVVRHLGGGTELTPQMRGGRPLINVYATNQPGIPEHEMVHAYCVYAFGWCGPEWFREGMAERAYHGWQASLVQCGAARAAGLKSQRPKIENILDSQQLGGQSLTYLENKNATPLAFHVNFEIKSIEHLRRSYDASWALCHFLGHHPRYRKGFHQFACGCLRGESSDLWDYLRETNAEELEFEFQQFLEHVEDGYDVAACVWPRTEPGSPLVDAVKVQTKVNAQQGFQDSGAMVRAGETYRCDCEGDWRIAKDTPPCSADGTLAGMGRLVAVVYQNHTLSPPIPLGKHMTFRAPQDGQLYLRCDEPLHQLHDNSGTIQATLAREDSPTAP